jgi:hypothetical protein
MANGHSYREIGVEKIMIHQIRFEKMDAQLLNAGLEQHHSGMHLYRTSNNP